MIQLTTIGAKIKKSLPFGSRAKVNSLATKFFYKLLLLTVALSLYSAQSYSQTNPYKAPLYWTPYEYNYTIDGAIPENVWSANIDWVDQNLKSYGYKTICIDGWGDDFVWNEHGYRVKHSSSWTNDYAWWAANLQSRGMNLGIYNNPLWINKAAANAGVLIKGTNIPLSSIMNPNETALWFTWVQVDKPGAEQYVKGYIQYYADMGVKYFRVDFLSWFEDGFDKNLGTVGPNRPHEHYVTALRWMKEACDANGMFLSLVMPHLKQEAVEEIKYGHMIRINEDVGSGGWARFNNFDRGIRHSWWSQYYNTFDGYTYWSYIAGRNKMILDGDFIRLNTMGNDEERKTVISLHLMAGGPLSVADQYNTAGSSLQFYQNTELLALNQDGFVGKPLSNDPLLASSQIWKGQMSNGDWIVGLFNREDGGQVRSINFGTDLGFTGPGEVRDLWSHTDLGSMTSFSANIQAHGCRILKITPPDPNKVVSPTFNPVAGTYTSAQNVTISTTTTGATIRYTTDGSTPNNTSAVYSSPINITGTTTVKAYATKAGMTDSNISSATYTLNLPPPAPWLHGDVGSVSPAGTAGYSNGLFSNSGAGADIEGSSDGFHYIYQAVTGDVTVTARVESLTNTNDWAKAGVMIRETLDHDAANLMTALTPVNGITFQRRLTKGGTTSANIDAGLSAPYWVRLQRTGNNVSAYRSVDGISWTQVGSTIAVTLPSTIYVGMAVTSHSNGTLSTASYSNVSVTTTGTVSAPVFTPAAGTYTSAQSITISSTTSGATIRYTTDGSTPNSSSAVYTAPLNISSTTTLKAYASKSGMTDSPVTTGLYTINIPTVATPTFSPSGGTYSSAQSITIACATAGATIRYTTDGTTPNSTSTIYSGAINVASSTTIKAFATKSGLTDSQVATSVYTIGVATPVFTPTAGTYSSTQSVTITCSTSGATIRYTTNGTNPTSTSPIYSAPISVSVNTTVKAYATKSGLTDSQIATAAYTIKVAAPSFSPAGGTFTAAQSVTLSSATTGSTIRYTIDGSTPTSSSTLYTAPINISSTTVVKAFAAKSGMGDSDVSSATYTINNGSLAIGGIYKISARHSSKPMGIKDAKTDDNIEAVQQTYSGGNHQKWKVLDGGNGTYKLIAVHSNKALEIKDGKMNPGELAVQKTVSTAQHQLWEITDLGGGYYKITNKNSNLALGVIDAKVIDGATINQYSYSGATSMQWAFELLTPPGGRISVSDEEQKTIEGADIVTIYPNPAENFVTIDLTAFKDEMVKIKLSDITGKLLTSEDVLGGGKHEMNTSTLKVGSYIVFVKGKEAIAVKKLLIK